MVGIFTTTLLASLLSLSHAYSHFTWTPISFDITAECTDVSTSWYDDTFWFTISKKSVYHVVNGDVWPLQYTSNFEAFCVDNS